MDAHQTEYLAAVEGMSDTYGIVPTPPVMHVVGTTPVPVWNVGATVTWVDSHRHHHHGTVFSVGYAGEDRTPDQRVYTVKERVPGGAPRFHELTPSQLCEW